MPFRNPASHTAWTKNQKSARMINTTTAEASKQASEWSSDYMTPRCMIKTGNVSWITWAEWNSPYVCWFHLFLPFAAYNCWFNLRADDVTSEARFSTHNDNREEVIFNLNICSTWHAEWFWASNTIRLMIRCSRFSGKQRFLRRLSVGRILGFSLPVEKTNTWPRWLYKSIQVNGVDEPCLLDDVNLNRRFNCFSCCLSKNEERQAALIARRYIEAEAFRAATVNCY